MLSVRSKRHYQFTRHSIVSYEKNIDIHAGSKGLTHVCELKTTASSVNSEMDTIRAALEWANRALVLCTSGRKTLTMRILLSQDMWRERARAHDSLVIFIQRFACASVCACVNICGSRVAERNTIRIWFSYVRKSLQSGTNQRRHHTIEFYVWINSSFFYSFWNWNTFRRQL